MADNSLMECNGLNSEENRGFSEFIRIYAGKKSSQERLVILSDMTGYTFEQRNGQRVLRKEKHCSSDLRKLPTNDHECELYLSGLPKDVYEDELVCLIGLFCQIVEIRMMMEYSGETRGFCFITLRHNYCAEKVVKHLNDYQIRPGFNIVVKKSYDYKRLYVSGICDNLTESDIKNCVDKVLPGLVNIILYKDLRNKNLNRGFVFLDFSCHNTALEARKYLRGILAEHLNCESVKVAWAYPEDRDESEYKSNVLFIRGLSPDLDERHLRNLVLKFCNSSEVCNVRCLGDFAFVHFTSDTLADFMRHKLSGLIGKRTEVHFARLCQVVDSESLNLPIEGIGPTQSFQLTKSYFFANRIRWVYSDKFRYLLICEKNKPSVARILFGHPEEGYTMTPPTPLNENIVTEEELIESIQFGRIFEYKGYLTYSSYKYPYLLCLLTEKELILMRDYINAGGKQNRRKVKHERAFTGRKKEHYNQRQHTNYTPYNTVDRSNGQEQVHYQNTEQQNTVGTSNVQNTQQQNTVGTSNGLVNGQNSQQQNTVGTFNGLVYGQNTQQQNTVGTSNGLVNGQNSQQQNTVDTFNGIVYGQNTQQQNTVYGQISSNSNERSLSDILGGISIAKDPSFTRWLFSAEKKNMYTRYNTVDRSNDQVQVHDQNTQQQNTVGTSNGLVYDQNTQQQNTVDTFNGLVYGQNTQQQNTVYGQISSNSNDRFLSDILGGIIIAEDPSYTRWLFRVENKNLYTPYNTVDRSNGQEQVHDQNTEQQNTVGTSNVQNTQQQNTVGTSNGQNTQQQNTVGTSNDLVNGQNSQQQNTVDTFNGIVYGQNTQQQNTVYGQISSNSNERSL